MKSQISALAQTLTIYLIMGVAYYGWGRAATRVLGKNEQTGRFCITLIWLGWAFTLFIFQLLHLLFPLTAYVAAPVFVIGAAFSIRPIVNAFHRRQQEFSILVKRVGILIPVLAVTGWIASRSMLPPTNYDSGLYHLNAIRWINSFPIVPGLGNLHGRLAFNQSFFTYVAVLNFYPFFGHGCAVANSFLLLLTMATFVHFLRPVLKQPRLLIELHPFQHASILCALPLLGYLALSSNGLASPTPDLASTLLQLTLFVMLAQGIAEWIKGEGLKAQRVTVVTILAATAITIKLTNLAFSAVVIAISLAPAWQTSPTRRSGAVRVILPVVVVMLVWGFRGYLLSGAPLYPSTIGQVSVEWAVPIEKVVDEANWIYSWARQPDTHWSHVLGSWEWFRPWTERISRDLVLVVFPLVLAVVFCMITVMLVCVFKKKAWPRCLDWLILLPEVIGLVWWFFTVPDPRFAHALFWCLALSAALLFLSSVQPLLPKRAYGVVLCGVFVLANLQFIRYALNNRDHIKEVSSSGWHSIKTIPLIQKETSFGLVVFTPEQGDQCWDAPLPCTPYFNPDLRLRIPGKLGSGFTVKMPQRINQEKAPLVYEINGNQLNLRAETKGQAERTTPSGRRK